MSNKEIPEDLLDNIAKQNFKNIVDKVRSGKTLSRVELSMVDELKARGAEVDGVKSHPKITKSDKTMRGLISAEFGISDRKSFDWISRLGGMKTNLGWQVEEVLNEIEKRRKAAGSGTTPELVDLKKEKLQEEVWTLRLKRKDVEGAYVDYRETLSEMQRVFQGLRGAVESWRRHQSAKNPGQAEAVDQMADDLLRRMIETELDKSE
jgi:hypothetical protein